MALRLCRKLRNLTDPPDGPPPFVTSLDSQKGFLQMIRMDAGSVSQGTLWGILRLGGRSPHLDTWNIPTHSPPPLAGTEKRLFHLGIHVCALVLGEFEMSWERHLGA